MDSTYPKRLTALLQAVRDTSCDDDIDTHLDNACLAYHGELQSIAETMRTTSANPIPALEYDVTGVFEKLAELERQDTSSGNANELPVPFSADTPQQKTIGEYEIIEPIGRGGFGTVYRARHHKLATDVAIKFLHRPDDPARILRFKREMAAVGSLSHPNVVRALDAREVDGLQLLVTELIDGWTLSQLMERTGPLSVADAAEIIRQVAVGLQYIHEQNLVHRDIKPGNLMICRQSTVRILDLGLALFTDPAHSHSWNTSSHQIVGTIDYLAPEQLGDASRVDIRADIYSLGATLYWLLTGVPPYGHSASTSPLVRLADIAVKRPVAIDRRRPDLPEGLASLVMRMLERRPEDRFAAPVEVANAMIPWASDANLARLLSDDYLPAEVELRQIDLDADLANRSVWNKYLLYGFLGLFSLVLTALVRYSSDSQQTPETATTSLEDTGEKKTVQSEPTDNEIARSAIELGLWVHVNHADGTWEDLKDTVPDTPLKVHQLKTNRGEQITDISAELLSMWCRSPTLDFLVVPHNRVMSQKHIQALAQLNDWKYVAIGATEFSDVTDEDLEQLLRNCRKIETLDIFSLPVTGAFFSSLPNPQSLKSLQFRAHSHLTRKELIPKLSVDAIRTWQRFSNLETLNIARLTLSDAHLEALAQIKSLRHLQMNGTFQISPQGITYLSEHQNLRSLIVAGTGMDDAYLRILSKMQNLEELDINNNQLLTEQGILELQRSLPKCKITFFNTYPGTRGQFETAPSK